MPYPDDNNLTSLASLKLELQIPDAETQSDAELTTKILIASANFRVQTGLDKFVTQSVVEYRSGHGGTKLTTRVRPVTAVSLVKIGTVEIPVSDGTTAGYLFDETGFYLIGHVFYPGYRNIRLEYTGGVATTSIEFKLAEQAVLEMAAAGWRGQNPVLVDGDVKEVKSKTPDNAAHIIRTLTRLSNGMRFM